MDIAPIWTPQFSALISAHGMAALNFPSCMSFNFNDYISNFKLYNYKPQDDKTKSLTAWSHDFRAARATELEWNKRHANLYPKKIGENRGGKEWEISFSELQKFMMKKETRTKHHRTLYRAFLPLISTSLTAIWRVTCLSISAFDEIIRGHNSRRGF